MYAILTVILLHSDAAKDGVFKRRSSRNTGSFLSFLLLESLRITKLATFSSCFVNGSKISVVNTLKILCEIATPMGHALCFLIIQ